MMRGNAATILVVDDDPIGRMVLRKTLEDDGYTVIEAEDGWQALKACERHLPTLLVVDALMPVMDGFTLCRSLRADPAMLDVPILMATGLDDMEAVAQAYEAGATDFIAKPIHAELLRQRVRYLLRNNQQSLRFAAALDNMSQGLCMFGADERLIVANARFRSIFQLPETAVAPGRLLMECLQESPLFAQDTGIAIHPDLASYLQLTTQHRSETLVLELPDRRTLSITHEPMTEGGAEGGFVDTFTDITEQRRAEARIEHMALHDHLTDLPNRLLFQQRLEYALLRVARGEHCAVLHLDVAGLKAINETLGHATGDALLLAVAARLHGLVRPTDTVARLDGDEFAIVQASTEGPASMGHGARVLAERILKAFQEPFEIGGHHLTVGLGLGIAIAPEDGTDVGVLLRNADIALQQAKSEGRNRFRCFEPIMNELIRTRRELEFDLRQAIEEGEFEVHFQPLLSLAESRITGCEALVRWRSPRRGLVSPAQFIPVAEQSGMILQIGEWVLREACRSAADWPGAVKVSVNISAVQFTGGHLVQSVRQALEQSGLAAHRLDLEITESVMINDIGSTLALLHDLKALGVSISMDDFGTGYSSLSYIRSFPFDKIKIDQSFVRDLGKKPESVAIIRAVKGICDSLGMTTTAEGVETLEQLALLQAEQCSEIQGYLISKPRQAREIPALITSSLQPGWAKQFMA